MDVPSECTSAIAGRPERECWKARSATYTEPTLRGELRQAAVAAGGEIGRSSVLVV
jgi:hypothetical protein